MLVTILSCAVLILLSQLIRFLVVANLLPVGSVALVPRVLELHYVENTGAAFSIFAGRTIFLVIITGIALAVIAGILLFRKPSGKLEYIGFIMIFSGGMGNLIERIAYGYVVDYFRVLFMNFAVFNFADCLVCLGFAALIVAFIHTEVKLRKQKKLEDAAPTPAGQAESPGKQEDSDGTV